MPKLFLQNDSLNIESGKSSTTARGLLSERDFLKERSKKLSELIAKMDAKTLTETRGMADLMDALHEEFGTVDGSVLPLGIVSKCFLGHPYEVHVLDMIGGQIVKHYRINEPLPPDFEKARMLAKHNAYAWVEVYHDKVILIREDGSASKL